MSRRVLLTIVLLIPAGMSRAVDGVIEINQARAAAGGINGSLATDPAGFPVVISEPGSYRLTSSLTSPELTGAITILADGVTLDLNGFRITTEIPAAGVDGIDAAGRAGIRVTNGTVEGFGGEGIDAGERARIEGVSVNNNGSVGIRVSHLSAVSRNNLKGNGSLGIETGAVCTVSENIVELSNGAGIFTPNRSSVTGNTVNANSGPGIEVGYGSTVSGNISSFNTGNGIRAGEGSTVRENTVRNNLGDGIRADAGCTLSDNSVRSNTGDGIEIGDSSTVTGNAVSANGRCGLHAPAPCAVACAFSGWAHNVISANNGGASNRQVYGPGLEQLSAVGSGDSDKTNVCSGSVLLSGNLCFSGAANNCP